MSREKFDEMSDTEIAFYWIWRVLAIGLVLTLSLLWGCPNYRVYQQNLEGEAELARATQNRQIAIQEAQAKKESAQHLADAEVIRASGVAKANVIIGKSLDGNDSYLHYLFINNLENTKNQVIYLPTEAGLPILEANRK